MTEMKTRGAEYWWCWIALAGAGLLLANWDDLKAYLDVQTQVGQMVRLTLWRDGQSIDVEVTLGQEPF